MIPSSPAVELDRVSRLFGAFAALRNVSLTVETGAKILLLGENGAGKSTLLRLIAGLGDPSFGTVTVFGQPPLHVRERIAYMSHSTMLYDELTARENLRYVADLYDLRVDIDAALHAVALDPANPRRVGEYSQGMRQRTALARTLMTAPDLLLLDEPFSNLDVSGVARMVERLQEFLAEPGTGGAPRTLFMTTHQRELAAPLAPEIITLTGGRIQALAAAPEAAR